jgi:hypothetical protein
MHIDGHVIVLRRPAHCEDPDTSAPGMDSARFATSVTREIWLFSGSAQRDNSSSLTCVASIFNTNCVRSTSSGNVTASIEMMTGIAVCTHSCGAAALSV